MEIAVYLNNAECKQLRPRPDATKNRLTISVKECK